MPNGIRLDGGSDWFAIQREFAQFIVDRDQQDEEERRFLLKLDNWFGTTLLPVETFFHTVLHNTRFCESYVAHNLRSVKWERARGCQCQHSGDVDWCGCSPQVIYAEADKEKLKSLKGSANFFARKFDGMLDWRVVQEVVGGNGSLFWRWEEEMD